MTKIATRDSRRTLQYLRVPASRRLTKIGNVWCGVART